MRRAMSVCCVLLLSLGLMGQSFPTNSFDRGSTSSPSRAYRDDPQLGSYRIGPSNEGFASDGRLRWHWSATLAHLTAGLDLRVGGGGVFQSSVGIGIDTPTAGLHVVGSARVTDNLAVGGLSVGGSNVTLASGQVLLPAGTALLPALSFSADANTGLWSSAADTLNMALGGVNRVRVDTGNGVGRIGLAADDGTTFSALFGQTGIELGAAGSAVDTAFVRDAADNFAFRRGTNAQILNIYRTWTDASNYERFQIAASGTTIDLVTQAAGTGTARALRFGVSGGLSWTLTATTAHFEPLATNTYNIGSAAARPLTVFAGTSGIDSTGALVSTGSAVNSIGGGTDVNTRLRIGQGVAFSPTGLGANLVTDGTINAAVGQPVTSVLVGAAETFVEAASGTHAYFAALVLRPPTITAGVATVTDTATLYITGAMSATVTGSNYALWVDSGVARFDGNIGESGNRVPGAFIGTSGIDSTGNIVTTTSITSSGATQGIGYAAGCCGTVTQITSKSTGVTLNNVAGDITMTSDALAGDTTVSFVLTNSAIAGNDFVMVQHKSAGTAGSYLITVTPAAGSATINVRNITTGSLSEAIVIKFAVFKSAVS